jgi:hypothetical protein
MIFLPGEEAEEQWMFVRSALLSSHCSRVLTFLDGGNQISASNGV